MQDLKYALRMFAKNPLFTGVAVLTLGLGIGANAAIYTVVEAVLLEPLPFPEGEELYFVWSRNDELGQDRSKVSPLDFHDYRTQSRTFESLAGYWPTTGTVTQADGNPVRVQVVYTTENFFDLLGAQAVRGRALTADDGPGSVQVAILSWSLWQERFGGDPDVVGDALILDGSPLEIVGVLRPDQALPESADLWTNMTWPLETQGRQERYLNAIGRLGDDTGGPAGEAELQALAAAIADANPDTNRGWTVRTGSVREELVGDTRTALIILLGATGLILLIACATVANLLLSRAEVRSSEMAVRVAFGASRGHLVRQLLAESLVLAGAGAVLGLVLARVGVWAMLRVAPVTLPREESIGLDGTVLAVVLGVALLTGVLFGLAPVVRVLRGDLHSSIRQGGRGAAGGGSGRLQRAFVVTQFAVALVLVVGAGLLVRSFQNIRSIDIGFSDGGVLTAELDLPAAVAESDSDVIQFYEAFRNRIADLPGVQAVGDASTLPLAEQLDYTLEFNLLDRTLPDGLDPLAFMRPVSPGFLEALQIPVTQGRAFDDRDRNDGAGVLLVNEAFERRFTPGESALGLRFGTMKMRYGPLGAIHVSGDIEESEVVGVVKDVRYAGLRADVSPSIYFSGLQSSIRRRTIAVRTSGDPNQLVPLVRDELVRLSPAVALTRIQTLRDVVGKAQARDRFSTLLLGLFGLIALVLAAVGVYGVMAYAVEQRTGEVGIRMALGADRGNVRAMILRDGLKLVGLGLGAGVLITLATAGVLSTELYGVDPRDPVIYGAVLAVLLAVALAAILIPAARAAAVDPLIAMREE